MSLSSAPHTGPPLLDLFLLSKRFGPVLANDRVSLSLRAGEIHALLGENGAGKSTLVKMLAGVLSPDRGEIRLDGKPLTLRRPADARRHGIAMVFQHFTLFPALSVVENIALGLEQPPPLARLAGQLRDLSTAYGLPLDPAAPVASLSMGERQRVEILRGLMLSPRILVLDEPTSVLTPQEVAHLFTSLRRLRDEGRGILFISHKLDEVRTLCDRATILRAGGVVADIDPRTTPVAEIARAMVGALPALPPKPPIPAEAPVRLALMGASSPPGSPHSTRVQGASLTVRAGEIVGLAGIAGNGQEALMALLCGEDRAPAAAMVQLDGRAIGHLGPRARRRAGLQIVPADRLGQGAPGVMSLARSLLLTAPPGDPAAPFGWLRPSRLTRQAAAVIEAYGVNAPEGPESRADTLSGGNLQKFLLGREVNRQPAVLIAANPSWGVDTGAATRIHGALRSLAAAGSAVIVIGQDLDELRTLSDRLAVIHAGKITPLAATGSWTAESIGLAMAGLQAPSREHAAP